MKSGLSKVFRIGNSRRLRSPAKIPPKVHIFDIVAAEKKLSWEESAKAMVAAREDWSDWDIIIGDGIRGL